MKSIVFCSSQRFKKELEDFMGRLHKIAPDVVMLSPEFELDNLPESFYKLPEEERLKNDIYRHTVIGKVYDHLFRKIRVADVCYIFNKDGYLGPNVVGELFTAAALGKMIYTLDERCLTGIYPDTLHEEPCCKGLIHQTASNPEELVKYLA